jgi:hypothetical protein
VPRLNSTQYLGAKTPDTTGLLSTFKLNFTKSPYSNSASVGRFAPNKSAVSTELRASKNLILSNINSLSSNRAKTSQHDSRRSGFANSIYDKFSTIYFHGIFIRPCLPLIGLECSIFNLGFRCFGSVSTGSTNPSARRSQQAPVFPQSSGQDRHIWMEQLCGVRRCQCLSPM